MAVQTSLTNVGLEQFVILLESFSQDLFISNVSMHNFAYITSV